MFFLPSPPSPESVLSCHPLLRPDALPGYGGSLRTALCAAEGLSRLRHQDPGALDGAGAPAARVSRAARIPPAADRATVRGSAEPADGAYLARWRRGAG